MFNLSEVLTNLNINAEQLGCLDFDYISHAGATDTPKNERMLTFVNDKKFISVPPDNSVVITLPEYSKLFGKRGVCIYNDPRSLYYMVHNLLSGDERYRRRNNTKTTIGTNCNISLLAYIAKENVIIGNNVLIEEFVSIKENTVIGSNCIIQSGSVIGSEGFEYKRKSDCILTISHTGGVLIGDEVEILSNSIIDKAVYPWDNTVIGDCCKIGSLNGIYHGAKIGKRGMVAPGSIIAGRTVIGDDVWIGPGATISNMLRIGNNVHINIGAVVVNNIRDGESVSGNFAIKHSLFLRNLLKAKRE